MENIRKYDISFLGEFENKTLEKEFLNYDMKRNAKFIGPVTIIFGIIYMLVFIFDYYAIKDTVSFKIIFAVRLVVLVMSAVMYMSIRKISSNYTNIIYMITAYKIIVIASFLVILYKYETLTYLSLFSAVVITLAIYVMPNRLINSQIISVFFITIFYLFPVKNIESLEASGLLKIIGYNLVLFVFCNIGAYLTNFYKRKQFADNRELLRMSITDSLTGIYNRAKFGEEIDQWVDFCNMKGNPMSLVIFDIDDFKRVNDRYGHHMGDSVIKNIASTIKKATRNTDVFARWGGEEFVILLPNTDIRQAKEISERMRICIQKIEHSIEENITCSFGLVELKKNETAESLMYRADKLLYNAKDWGKNTVVCEADGIIGELGTNICY